ncbi:type II toxin-antitoxin system VapB family antitoxin [Brucella ciceri]
MRATTANDICPPAPEISRKIIPATMATNVSRDSAFFIEKPAWKWYLETSSRKEADMALSIKTEEADRLARELSRLTGETMTDAITQAMRERLERLRAEQEAQRDYVSRMKTFVRERAARYDRRPVTKREWDEAVGDTPEEPGFSR